jgi:hypothetical protein
MTRTDPPRLAWRKSSFGSTNGSCIEVALLDDGGVAMRDSKHGGTGPVLRYTAAEWEAFLAGVAAGEFTRP